MSLKKHFNLKRFYLALKYDFALNGKKYLLFFGGLCVVLLFVDLYMISEQSIRIKTTSLVGEFKRKLPIEAYTAYFNIVFVITTILVSGTAFSSFRTPQSTANYLLLPVSILEKFILEFGIRIVGFSLLFVVLFWLEFKLAVSFYHVFYGQDAVEIQNFSLVAPFYDGVTLDAVVVAFSLFSFASFFFAGASLFQKNALFKTILTFGCLILMYYIISVMLFNVLISKSALGFNFEIYKRPLKFNITNFQLFNYSIGVLSSFFLLPLTYFKLKEKEI